MQGSTAEQRVSGAGTSGTCSHKAGWVLVMEITKGPPRQGVLAEITY